MTENIEKIVESLLLSSSRPLTEAEILKAFNDSDDVNSADIKEALNKLENFYSERSIELVKVANGYRLKVKQEYSTWISKLWETKPQKFSRAMMETLALIAYKQPITRAEIEEVRGVSVSSQIIRNLMDRGWIKVVGHRDVPGRPSLLSTTKDFLDDLNLRKLSDLPELPDIGNIPEEIQMPLLIEEQKRGFSLDSGIKMAVRLQKAVADAGICSRRKAELLIESGRVFLNDKKARLGDKVEAGDKIFIDGKEIKLTPSKKRLIIYHKPLGEICSKSGYGKPTVFDNLPILKNSRWVALGRLDINTSGLLLFSNDGVLANKIIHPKKQVEREYLARIRGKPTEEDLEKLLKGIKIEGDFLKFTDVVRGRTTKSHTWFAMVIMEGKNRAVRKLWNSLGFEVSRLKRTRLGHIFLPADLSPGKFRDLEDKEIKEFLK